MIFVECRSDEVLVRSLGIPRREVVHASGKSGVCRRLERSRGSKGLVDEDPHSAQPPYMRSLILVAATNDVKILRDPRRGNYLIVLCLRLEEWVLEAARRAGVSLRDYGLPEDGESLHEVINLRVSRFSRLILDLRVRSGMMRYLEKALKDP